MCGRYALAGDWSEFTENFSLEETPGLTSRYNIAPSAAAGHEAPIVTRSGLVMARFWYIPSWWKRPLNQLPTSFNARSETALSKPLFRGFETCLVPTSGWREFPGPAGKKRAFQIFLPREVDRDPATAPGAATAPEAKTAPERATLSLDSLPTPTHAPESEFFAFGGLSSRWTDPATGEVISTFSILTAEPRPLVQLVHHRMPLLVPPDEYDRYLENAGDFSASLQPMIEFSNDAPLSMYETTTFGNGTRVEGPECIEPVGQRTSSPGQMSLF